MIKISSDNEIVQKFIDYVHSHLRKHKFKLVLHIDSLKIGDNPVSGYFSEDDKEIVISIKEENWLDVLVHEYNHFVQFVNNEECYINLNQGESNFLSEMWDWLDKEEEYEQARLDLIFETVVKMELDCEKKSIETIKKFDLPIDLNEYVSTAHIYLYFYLYARKFRVWFPEDFCIEEMEEFFELDTNTLETDFSKLPEEYEKIFEKYFVANDPKED